MIIVIVVAAAVVVIAAMFPSLFFLVHAMVDNLHLSVFVLIFPNAASDDLAAVAFTAFVLLHGLMLL